MKSANDKRVVMTLDAGGTNFVFSAFRANEQIVDPITYPSNAHDLELCMETLVSGFSDVKSKLDTDPVAISFAFPGPADYPNGIIGDLPNLPAFRGGVPLGAMLEEKFNLPVFINNDGNLYSYGEALSGYLPYVNGMLERSGSPKRYKNLIGITLGTGFGVGITLDGVLLTGDNSNGAEGWLLRDKLNPLCNIEGHVNIAAIKRLFCGQTKLKIEDCPEPKDIYDIAMGNKEGNKNAAIETFSLMGEALGEAVANIVTLIDGVVVIGGGVAGASQAFFPSMLDQLNSTYTNNKGEVFSRLISKIYNLENPMEMQQFLDGDKKELSVPGTDKTVLYDPMTRTGIGVSKVGASKAIALGAYAFALNAIDTKK